MSEYAFRAMAALAMGLLATARLLVRISDLIIRDLRRRGKAQ